jgi:transcriptional regulator with XRE-family HTH domain
MEHALLKILGQRIRDIRKQRGLSQEQLGELAGFHFSYIGGIERAEKNISVLNLEKISSALQVNIYDLFSYGKHNRLEISEKNKLINELNKKLITMETNDLRKAIRLLKEIFDQQ